MPQGTLPVSTLEDLLHAMEQGDSQGGGGHGHKFPVGLQPLPIHCCWVFSAETDPLCHLKQSLTRMPGPPQLLWAGNCPPASISLWQSPYTSLLAKGLLADPGQNLKVPPVGKFWAADQCHLPRLTDRETEAPRGEVLCTVSPSTPVAEPATDPRVLAQAKGGTRTAEAKAGLKAALSANAHTLLAPFSQGAGTAG